MRVVAIILLAVAPVAPVGCGQDGSPGGRGLEDERVSDWTRVEVVSARVLRVIGWASSDSCFGVRAAVEEDDRQVRIAFVEGVLPDAARECAAYAYEAEVKVTLDAPLGDREIVRLPAERVELAD